MFKLIKITLYGLMILHCASKFHAQMVNENLHTNDDDGDDDDAKLTVKGKDVTKVESMTVMVQPSVALEKENVQRLGAEYEKLKLIPMPLLIEEKEAIVKEIQEMQEDAEHKLATTEGEPKGDVEAKVQDSQPIEVEEEVILKELQQTMAGEQQQVLEQEDTSLPLDAESNVLAVNRTGRQLFYSPNFFYIQNIGVEGSKCVTSRGLLGICLGFDRCSLQQRRKRQLAFYSLTQLPQQFTAYAQQQQEEICTFYDQYARTSSGVCCTGINNVTPIMSSQQPLEPSGEEIPVLANEDGPAIVEDMNPTDFPKEGESSEDSDVLEPPENYNYEPEPPKYDNTELQDGNNIGYDPVYENLKQAQVYNNYNNYIRYPWPSQFVGFSGVQQWPPPLPTHPPSTASWPPPLPTHPPNHHYPTHPPTGQFNPAATTSTRRPVTARPTYPSYPTYRPVSTISTTTTTTTTTTKRPTAVAGNGGGVSANGLPLQCGMKNPVSPDQERIVGGTNASPHEFPWIAVLFKSGKQFCGGSLITNNHILTAAHCVARMTSWDVAALTVHLGDYNIRTDFEVQHVARRVKRLVRHKGFDFSHLHTDIAILTLNEPVKFTKEIQPICLPTSASQQTRSYSGHVATVAGWGSLRENGPQPSILQKVQIPIWTNSECAQKYGRAAPGGIIESMVCAGQAAKDSCSGDSGGPMIVNEGGRYVQVGIVSWGIGCGKGQYPGVYTRVTSLLPWIYKNIK